MRSFRIITTCLITMAIVLQASLTKADGDFYVGLLSYNNTEGLDCCGNQTDDSMCKDNCGLIFEVRVGGLNGTLHSKNLSSAEISLGEAISIPSNMTTNPLSFNFTEWPGSVNVTVVVKTIYNNRVNVLFDRFEHTFDDSYPTVFYYYSDVNSVFFGENSRLVILFRYQCRDLNGNGCFGDCLEHSDTEPCPPTEATPNNTYTWNKDHSCDETGNCSPDTTTPPDGVETTTDSGASLTKADGDFYVGLLSYNNTEGLDCCGNQTDDSMCKDNCGLIFEVRVGGLNGTLHSKNLSSAEISLGEAISIPSNMTTNPLSFNFTEWPGSVNVTVVVKTIYNNRVNVLFDRFEHTFDDSYPTVFYYYSDVNSVFFGENSRLVILFRYQCRDLNGNGCFGDCLEHSDTEPCPPTEATPNNTYTWNKDHSCDETGNCSPDTTTPPDGVETTTDSGASLTKADGDFYVGLLSYNNTEGLDCCGNQTDDSMCKDNCGLIFEVRVGGLNGTLHSKNLSSAEISLGEAISIPSNMTTNPLSFNFTEWPGSVNVTVVVKTIYNNRVNVLFDRFEHTFDDSYPTVFYYYSDVNSVFFGENSRLVILFRYQCRDLNGNGCFGDCLEHSDTEPCPPTEATPNNTYTWNKDHSCDETGNCSPDTTTPPDGVETTTDSGVDNNNISTGVTTRIYNDSGSSRNSTTESKDQISTIKQDPITITTAVYESQDGNNKTTESFTTTKINTISNDRITTDTLGKSPSTLSTILQSTQPTVDTSLLSTTPEEISTKIDDRNPVYWPAIVGGVLGGVAFLSAIGFLIYYRRQKKMRRRQEIYNVNPKVLRNFEEYEENGTSGRADVPLETEQY